MNTQIEIKQTLQRARKKAFSIQRQCMYPNCHEAAINSHVFQKNGILTELSKKQHLYTTEPTSPFELDTKGTFHFRRIGINEVYAFPGFCKKHDREIFKDVEGKNPNFFEEKNQFLLGYRCICQEIRRKEIACDIIKGVDTSLMDPAWIVKAYWTTEGYKRGILNLNYFKSLLEQGIINNDFSKYRFETIKIPRIEVCLSAPVNIDTNELIFQVNEYSMERENDLPMETNLINIFPKEDCSYAIIGYDESFKNEWARSLLNSFKTDSIQRTFKTISDLVTARIEFWCLSEKVFQKIPKQVKSQYIDFFMNNVFNHSAYIFVDFNLFENIE